MRAFCFIFIFYLLFLSAQPCQDLAAGEFARPPMASEQTRLQNNYDSQPESGECSPFCICLCRQISATDDFPVFASRGKTAFLTNAPVPIFYRNDYSHQHLTFIWQPPKFNFTA
jgi:hypothetical protein